MLQVGWQSQYISDYFRPELSKSSEQTLQFAEKFLPVVTKSILLVYGFVDSYSGTCLAFLDVWL